VPDSLDEGRAGDGVPPENRRGEVAATGSLAGGVMKNFNWRDLLRRHPVLSSVTDKEIEHLLKDEVSEERHCPQKTVILREGEISDSVFLIGSGSLKAVLVDEEGHEVTLSTLKKGELFGEMALLEQRPRSATVIAREDCTLLEVRGPAFLRLLDEHPDIQFKVLLTLSERLRNTNEELLRVKLKGVDEKLNLLNAKLEAELKAIDASLKAAQAVFDQTKIRTDEIIYSAERSRMRLTTLVGVVAGALALLGFLGFKEILNISEARRGAADMAKEAERAAKSVMELEQDIKKSANRLKLLEGHLPSANHQAAILFYDQLRRFRPDDPAATLNLLNEIERGITEQPEQYRQVYAEYLRRLLKEDQTPREKIIAYYLFLTVLILDNRQEEFRESLSAFQKYAGEHRDQRIKRALDFSLLEELFEKQDREKQTAFRDVKGLIPCPRARPIGRRHPTTQGPVAQRHYPRLTFRLTSHSL
jgi:CRP-like cAMP-binding protein